MPNTIKTLPVEVYRCNLGDTTNGGISASRQHLYLACDDGFVDMDPSDPVVLRIVKRELFGKTYIHAESYCGKAAVFSRTDGATVGPMMGGNFIWSCDSRFPADYPIPLHDRYETQAQYDMLSH